MAGDCFDDQEKGPGPRNHRPPGTVAEASQHARTYRRDHGADIGHEPQNHSHHAPKRGAGYADSPKTAAYDESKNGVERELCEEEAAQPLAGVVESCRGALEVLSPHKPDQTIAQIVLLEKNEYDENDDNAGRGKGGQSVD